MIYDIAMLNAPFTKDTAGLSHKRWWKIKLGDRHRAMAYLDIIEIISWKSRNCIRSELSRSWMKASSIEDVVKYIQILYINKNNGED